MTQRTMNENKRILIVEDSATQAAQLQFMLEQHGYEITHVRNGVEARELLKTYKPALILSDVVMPEMDGYELCHHLKSDPELRHIPVVLLTTLAEPTDIFRGLESGADHYTLKPYEADTLLSRVDAIFADKFLRGGNKSQMGLEITYAGRKYFLNADRIQILDLLLATFENTVRKNKELETLNRQLQESLETIKVLRGLIPICSYCHKIRDDEGFWERVDIYIQKHSEASFTHGICPDCKKQLYSQIGLVEEEGDN
jgi:two-component system cell cycle response regulator